MVEELNYLFEKEKISVNMFLDKKEELIRHTGILDDLLEKRLTAFILQCQREKKIISHQFDRPTFFEWLFRKKRTIKIEVSCSDVLENPPQVPETIRFYEVKVLEK